MPVNLESVCVKLSALLSCALWGISGAIAPSCAGDDGVLHESLLLSDGSGGFGYSIAMTDIYTVVGAPWETNENGQSAGAAYLYDSVTRQLTFKLLPQELAQEDRVGHSVAVDGDIVLLGSPDDEQNGFSSGSVYAFDANTGEQLRKIIADDGETSDQFGLSVAITGTTAVIGAPRHGGYGAVYLFDVTTGEFIAKIVPDDVSALWGFGRSVAVSGTTAVITAGSDSSVSSTGSVYIYDISEAEQIGKLVPDDGSASDVFGSSIAIRGDRVIVGAPGDPVNGTQSGSAYLFDVKTGMLLGKILPRDGGENERFGRSVALCESSALIGAEHRFLTETGAAYIFDVTTHIQLEKLLPSESEIGDSFGAAVALTDKCAIVGAPSTGFNGAAYLFALADSDCVADVNGDGSVNLSDLNIVLAEFGQQALAGDANGDGIVNLVDLNLVLASFGTDCDG